MHPGYKIEQAVLFPIVFIGITLSAYQLYLCQFLSPTSTSKRNIHITLFIELILWIPHLIDPYGLNGITALWADQLFSDCALLSAVVAFEFIIYSHFQAHYGALKKETPYYIPLVLQVASGGQGLCLFLSDILVFLVGVVSAINLVAWATVLFLLTLLVLDVGSFVVMYRLMMEMLQAKDMPRRCGEDMFRGLLTRMKRFHGIVIPLLFISFAYYTSQAATNAKHPVIVSPKSPNDFVLSGAIPACLAMYWICIWWAWIPHSTTEAQGRPPSNESDKNKRTTQQADTHQPSAILEIPPLHTPSRSPSEQQPQTPQHHQPSLQPSSVPRQGSEDREASQVETETPLLKNVDRRATGDEEEGSGRQIFNPHVSAPLSPSTKEEDEGERKENGVEIV